MGANSSKDNSRGSSIQSIGFKNKPQDLVDFGTIFPNGLYSTTPQDFDTRALRQLIITRKLAPFYKGLNDAPEPITISSLTSPPSLHSSTSLSTLSTPSPTSKNIGRPRSASNRSEKIQKNSNNSNNNNNEKELSHSERMKQHEAMLYNDAVECPICFLYYPPNINYSRCCDQPICTECFIQIHRPTDDPTSPATCPFCLEANYGITYQPPPWSQKTSSSSSSQQKRLRSFSASSSSSSSSINISQNNNNHNHMNHSTGGARHTTSGVSDERKPRRKSVSHSHPDVVLIDHIRPHWNKPIVSSTRSSRRNSLTNTSSPGRNLLRVVTRPGRSASSAASTEYNQYLANVRDMNMDLEEWMVMEAIRLSLAEHEEQARQQEQQGQQQQEIVSSPSIIVSSDNNSMSSYNNSSNSNNDNTSDHNTIDRNNNDEAIEEEDDDDEQPLALRIPHYQQQHQQQEQEQEQQQLPQQEQSTLPNQCKSSSSSIKETFEVQQNTLNKKSSGHDPQTSNNIIC
ncbi:hypothetical protein BJ944DRAFT_244829 [Cunninghamella echinulata]|nr:hypothetical protein BJ944DRAFT_244829 [Cunninghamella echinulata]